MTQNDFDDDAPQPGFVAVITPYRDTVRRLGFDCILDLFEQPVMDPHGDFRRTWGDVALSSHIEGDEGRIYLTADTDRPGSTLDGFQDAVAALALALGVEGVVKARREVIVSQIPRGEV